MVAGTGSLADAGGSLSLHGMHVQGCILKMERKKSFLTGSTESDSAGSGWRQLAWGQGREAGFEGGSDGILCNGGHAGNEAKLMMGPCPPCPTWPHLAVAHLTI